MIDVVCADVFDAELPLGEARIVYADPPYTAEDYFGYGTAPAWETLLERMIQLGAPDCAYVLHSGTSNLADLLATVEKMAPKRRRKFAGQSRGRVLAWVKPWSAWRPNVSFQWAWEPIVVFYGTKYRQPKIKAAQAVSDWLECAPKRPVYGHPTEKPERVIVWTLDRLTQGARGRLAIDLFSGTGTAAICCAEYGMDAIAVERDPKWADVIRERARHDLQERLPFLDRSPLGEKLVEIPATPGEDRESGGSVSARYNGRREGSPGIRAQKKRSRQQRVGGGIARIEQLAGRLDA